MTRGEVNKKDCLSCLYSKRRRGYAFCIYDQDRKKVSRGEYCSLYKPKGLKKGFK